MDNFQCGTVKRLVQFMYTGDYDIPEDNPTAADAAGEPVSFLDGSPAYPANPSTDEGNGTEIPPPTSPTPEPSAVPLLLGHIQANAIGDYYQVDGLVSLANNKIKQLLQNHSDDESLVASLPAAVEEAIELTGNKELFGILAEAAAVNISALLDMESFRSLSVMSDFSFHVMQGCAEENLALTAELEETQRKLRGTERHWEEQKEQLQRVRRCLEALKNTTACRNINCTAVFQCYIDPDECILRCASCRCKH